MIVHEGFVFYFHCGNPVVIFGNLIISARFYGVGDGGEVLNRIFRGVIKVKVMKLFWS